MSKQLQDLEIDLGLLKNRLVELAATVEILKAIVIAERVKSSGLDRETVKSFIDEEIKSLTVKIQGTPG